MTDTSDANRRGFPGKFLGAVTLVFTVQLALVFWLGNRSRVVPGKPATAPTFRLGDSRPRELAALEDPTLFVLPHREGFSGEAWMKMPSVEFESKDWSADEPLHWLATPQEELGAEFTEFMGKTPTPPFENIVMVEPTLTFPQLPPAIESARPSMLRIAGDLARRRLLYCAPLPNNVAFLTNSVVQLLVDAPGNAFSAVLLGAGAGNDGANKEALRIAQTMRFESIEPTGPDRLAAPAPKLMLGTLTFEWQTLPATNGSATLP
jgi:hypothetical protein